jgi:hypothetical protein
MATEAGASELMRENRARATVVFAALDGLSTYDPIPIAGEEKEKEEETETEAPTAAFWSPTAEQREAELCADFTALGGAESYVAADALSACDPAVCPARRKRAYALAADGCGLCARSPPLRGKEAMWLSRYLRWNSI